MSSFDNRDDEAAKFSFATPRSAPEDPGKINFDDRGNAVYEWKDPRLQQEGKQAERLRSKALSYAGLSLVDEEPEETETLVTHNDKGLRVGYNPYQSGMLAGSKPATKRRSMQELSKWIEMKRRLEQQNKR